MCYKVDLFLHLSLAGYMESQRCIAVDGDEGGDSATMKINHLALCSNTRLNCLNTLSTHLAGLKRFQRMQKQV